MSSYNDVKSVVKESGSPSNNMLLSMIYSETKRSSDLISKLDSRLARLESALCVQTANMKQMCELMKTQNTIMSSQQNFSRDTSFDHDIYESRSNVSTQRATTLGWFYQGFVLNKTKIISCIISHLIELVNIQMESKSMHYPDSVDANFTTLECCVRESCEVRCKIPAVVFKDPLDLPDLTKNRTAYDSILPLISSKDGNMFTMFPEVRLHELFTPLTRPTMQAVARVVERIKRLEGILSVQQIDILKSLGFPVVSLNSECNLNWNPDCVLPRESNPMSFKIHASTPACKGKFVREVISEQSVVQAYANQINPTK
ncbi:hypothetical protein GcM1_209018 [Golovinomyces cichoracearum]|uniref:Uncharacterized protein n=1 Tax=Golovinomyces cichoracearum TaxID=62708 RepID=A0A420IVR9_9PEZI|nr:hypothetical protein GcM1_209018 [Golovinomyces cichoracearum]